MQVTESTVTSIVNWLQAEFAKRGKAVAVVGVSGGIDSAVVATLCKRAPTLRLVLLMIPSVASNPQSLQRAERLSALLNVKPFLEYLPAMSLRANPMTNRELGNLAARQRMIVLYHYASLSDGLVVGTSNKSEVMLGYGTLHGDIACDIAPLANLYKTEVIELAKLLNVPQEIIDAVPSADLWPLQTDEGELGFSYANADKYFQTSSCGNAETDVKIFNRVQATAFKREPIPTWRW